jgi:photosystem II reaction center protein PsbP
MICKGRLYWMLPLFLLSFVLSNVTCNMRVASAQQHTTNFLTYTDTDLGFTIKYPSDWKSTVTKGSGGSNYVVFYSALDFSSGRNISTVLVGVADANATTLDELISQYKSSERKILGESKTTLSGLPAHKIVIQSDASRTTTVQFTLKDGKQYGISYDLGQSDDLPIIQQMIDSFRITTK